MKSIVDLENLLVKPYIDTKDKAYAANIAPIETSPATSAHTAGTQIIYNGVLYDVTADIAANDVLAATGVGANIAAADDVSKQISNVNKALTDEAETRSTLGAKNIYDVKNLFVTNNTGGLTVSIDDDGVISLTGGTASSGGYFMQAYSLQNVKIPFEENKKYIFSIGTRQSGLWLGVFYRLSGDSGWRTLYNVANVSECEFTVPSGIVDFWVRIGIDSGVTYSTAKFYPMIRLATDTDPTYQPYAMTNRELTDKSIKYVDVTDTTNANGRIEYLLSSGVPISAIVTSANYKYVVIATYDGVPKLFYIKDGNDNSVLANTQVTLRIYYIE